jgi:ABC-type dipeptide/oligopeptide/nickel transport system permease component
MDPKLVEQAKNLAEVRLEQQNMSDEMISKNMEIIDTMFQPIPLAALVLFVTLLSVLIIGAILGFFLKKERNVFDV